MLVRNRARPHTACNTPICMLTRQASGAPEWPSDRFYSLKESWQQALKEKLDSLQGMISAADFAAGAQQLLARLAACGESTGGGDGGGGGDGSGSSGSWVWRPIRSAFNHGPVSCWLCCPVGPLLVSASCVHDKPRIQDPRAPSTPRSCTGAAACNTAGCGCHPGG